MLPFRIVKESGEACGGTKAGHHGRTRKGVDAAAVLPEIPTRERKAGLRIAKFQTEICRTFNERWVHPFGKLGICIAAVVLPQCPQHEGGLVLLDGHQPLLPPVIP